MQPSLIANFLLFHQFFMPLNVPNSYYHKKNRPTGGRLHCCYFNNASPSLAEASVGLYNKTR